MAGGAGGRGKLGSSHAQLLSNSASGASISQGLVTFFRCGIGNSSLFCCPALFFGARGFRRRGQGAGLPFPFFGLLGLQLLDATFQAPAVHRPAGDKQACP